MAYSEIFRDDFNGSGPWNGRVSGLYTWTATGNSTIAGGKIDILSGSGNVPVGGALASHDKVDIQCGFSPLASGAHASITLAQFPNGGDAGIGNGFRMAYNYTYDNKWHLSVNQNVVVPSLSFNGNVVVRFSLDSASNTVNVYTGTAEDAAETLVASPVSAGGLVGPFDSFYLALDGAYEPYIDFVSVKVQAPDPIRPSGPKFWTAFIGSREVT